MDTPTEKIAPKHNADGNTIARSVLDAPQGHGARLSDGIAPRTVIRGESFITSAPSIDPTTFIPNPATPAYAALTDWLNCTFPLHDSPEFIIPFFKGFCEIVGNKFAPMTERGSGRGLHGWKRSFKLGNSGGLFGIGGQRDTAFLSLSGDACALIAPKRWGQLASFLEQQYQARITRWDGAVDDFEGKHSVDWAVKQYLNNQFNNGGNKPSCTQHGNWIEPDGTGRTFEVGKRANGKLIRIYEKGKQLGDSISPWVRWEVEFHNVDRVIPWDVLANPGGYVAGAYPCISWASKKMCRIKTAKKSAEICYDSLTHHAKRAFGKLINVMSEVEGSSEKVVERLIRKGTPSRLEIPVHSTDTRKLLKERK